MTVIIRIPKRIVLSVFGVTSQHCLEWFQAAREGNEERVAKFLKHHPVLVGLVDATAKTALHHAAEHGHDKVVARLLAAYPGLIHMKNWGDSRLLQEICDGRTALHFAASNGHEKVFAQLLAASPETIDAVNARGATVLHYAARNGHEGLVDKILTLRPEMISVVDSEGTALGYAVEGGHEKVAEKMLTLKPELVYRVVAKSGNTILHAAVRGNCSKQFVAKVLRMNPQALFKRNKDSRTPFHIAMVSLTSEMRELVELFQLSLSFDDNMAVVSEGPYAYSFDVCRLLLYKLVERQCEFALWESLPRDVVGTVCEYIGFKPQQPSWKRGQREEEESAEEGGATASKRSCAEQ